jgi:hypothetical protein
MHASAHAHTQLMICILKKNNDMHTALHVDGRISRGAKLVHVFTLYRPRAWPHGDQERGGDHRRDDGARATNRRRADADRMHTVIEDEIPMI